MTDTELITSIQVQAAAGPCGPCDLTRFLKTAARISANCSICHRIYSRSREDCDHVSPMADSRAERYGATTGCGRFLGGTTVVTGLRSLEAFVKGRPTDVDEACIGCLTAEAAS